MLFSKITNNNPTKDELADNFDEEVFPILEAESGLSREELVERYEELTPELAEEISNYLTKYVQKNGIGNLPVQEMVVFDPNAIKILPKDEGINTVDKVIEIASSGKRAWGVYKHDSIVLYNAAEKGTVYHEAFHRVTLGYLTQEEREAVYDDARRKYNLRGLSNREVEEYLAEEFRDFMIRKGENRTLVGTIKDFFTRLRNFIESVFTGQHRLTTYETDSLFNAIYDGKFRRNSILKENLNNLGRQDYTREIYGTEFETLDTIGQIRGVVKSLTYALVGLNKKAGNITDLNDVSTIDFNLLIEDRVKKLNGMKARLAN